MLHTHEWLTLLVRWLHVLAGIMWIGDSFLFMWLDSHLSQEPSKKRDGAVVGELWMVHSGGFYEVVKRKFLAPNEMPERLFWFKWESYTTWISGFFLLGLVYYHGARIYLVDAARPAMSPGAAIGLSFTLLVVSWLAYDLLWRSPLAKAPRALSVTCVTLLIAAAYGLSQVFTGRGLFIQVGAMMGTVMAANVFFRIIPAQKNMLAATKAGTPVDTSLGARAKQRSTHNHYMTLPVLLTMLSNHFPSAHGATAPWLVLGLFLIFGAGIKLVMNKKGGTPPFVWLGTAGSLIALIFLTAPVPDAAPSAEAFAAASRVTLADAHLIIQKRCVSCHAAKPSDPSFLQPPSGVVLEHADEVQKYAERIYTRAVATKTMPLGNLTGMTDTERAQLGAWYAHRKGDAAPSNPSPNPTPTPPATATTSTGNSAKTVFEQRCAVCHGLSGLGDGMAAASLNPKPRNYRDSAWQASVTDDDLRRIIVQGGAALGKSPLMPGNPDLEKDAATVDGLVQIIRSFGRN